MIISYSKMFVVQHMEKTGGTTVTHSLAPHLEMYDMVINDWTKLIFNREGDVLSEHAPSMIIAKYLENSWHDFKKFSTVRNPVDILKSFYSYSKNVYEEHFEKTNEIPPDGSLKGYVYSEKTGYGPDGFVDYMIARGYPSVSPQVERLHHIINDGLIVDLKDLNNKWDDITYYLGFDKNIEILHKNSSNSSSITFSDKTITKIKKHFEKDYDIIPKITGVNW